MLCYIKFYWLIYWLIYWLVFFFNYVVTASFIATATLN